MVLKLSGILHKSAWVLRCCSYTFIAWQAATALKQLSDDVTCQSGQTYFQPACLCGLCADQQDVRQRMNLRWGVMPFRLDFAANPEENIEITFK